MILEKLLQLLGICGLLGAAHGFWGEELLTGFVQRFKKDAGECKEAQQPYKKKPTPNVLCDENQFMMQLARLYIISPERIVLLLTKRSLQDTCSEVNEVVRRVNATLATCIPLPPENLYMRLIDGLRYFHTIACAKPSTDKKARDITTYHNCMRELRDDFIDCEGPADWYEKSNQTFVCPYYNDIVDCHYIKTAMLCGLTPAMLTRTFADEVMKRTVGPKCKVSRSLPRVDYPMPASATNIYLKYFTLLLLYFLCNYFVK